MGNTNKLTVPKELYDELLEKYEELLRENERLKNQSPVVIPRDITPTIPTKPYDPWYKDPWVCGDKWIDDGLYIR